MRSDEPILTISVASKLLHLHPRTLMLYERSGLTLPHRTGTKRRLYSVLDLEHLQFVKHLTQKEGVNLKGTKLILNAIDLAKKDGVDLRKLLFPSFKLVELV